MGASARRGRAADTAPGAAPGAYARRCRRMVRDQILGRGIDREEVLQAFLRTPRHLFVDEALAPRAYGDSALPIGHGQTISQPYIVARMIQLLEIEGGSKVLEVGTGSGYQAAILSRLAGAVYTIERIAPLARRARENWERAGAGAIHLKVGDGSAGWPDAAPFAAILVSAATPAVPRALIAQLAPGGRVVAPVGNAVRQALRLVRCGPAGGLRIEEHDACAFVRLVGREGFPE